MGIFDGQRTGGSWLLVSVSLKTSRTNHPLPLNPLFRVESASATFHANSSWAFSHQQNQKTPASSTHTLIWLLVFSAKPAGIVYLKANIQHYVIVNVNRAFLNK